MITEYRPYMARVESGHMLLNNSGRWWSHQGGAAHHTFAEAREWAKKAVAGWVNGHAARYSKLDIAYRYTIFEYCTACHAKKKRCKVCGGTASLPYVTLPADYWDSPTP